MERKHRLQKLEERILQLEKQVARLQAADPRPQEEGTILVEPVRIVDTEGNRLLDIQRIHGNTRIDLYNTHDHIAASMGADGTQAGYLLLNNGAGRQVMYVNLEMHGMRLILDDDRTNGEAGIVLFANDAGEEGCGINLATSRGQYIGLWMKPDDGGTLEIHGDDGETLAAFRTGEPRPDEPGHSSD